VTRWTIFRFLNRVEKSNHIPTRALVLILSALNKIDDEVFSLYAKETNASISLQIKGPNLSEHLGIGLPYLNISAWCSSRGNLFGPITTSFVERFFTLRPDMETEWKKFAEEVDWIPFFAAFLCFIQYQIISHLPFEAKWTVTTPLHFLSISEKIKGLEKTIIWGYDKNLNLWVFTPIVHIFAEKGSCFGINIQSPSVETQQKLTYLLASLFIASEDSVTMQTKKQLEGLCSEILKR